MTSTGVAQVTQPSDQEWMRAMCGQVTTFEHKRGISLLRQRRHLEFRIVPPAARRPLPPFAFDARRIARKVGRWALVVLPILCFTLVVAVVLVGKHAQSIGTDKRQSDQLAFAVAGELTRTAAERDSLRRELQLAKAGQPSGQQAAPARAPAPTRATPPSAPQPTQPALKGPQGEPPRVYPATVATGPETTLLATANTPPAPVSEAASKPASGQGGVAPAQPVISPNPRAAPAPRTSSAFVSKARLGLAAVAKDFVTTIAGAELRAGQILPTGERIMELRQVGNDIEIITDQRSMLVLP